MPVDDVLETDTPMMTVTRTAQAVRGGISSALNGGHRSGDYADDHEALEEMVIDIDGDHGGTIRQTVIGGAKGGNGNGPWPVWSAVNVSLERERTVPESSQTEWVEGVGVTARRRRKIVGLITCQVISVKKIRGPMFFILHRKISFISDLYRVCFLVPFVFWSGLESSNPTRVPHCGSVRGKVRTESPSILMLIPLDLIQTGFVFAFSLYLGDPREAVSRPGSFGAPRGVR